MEIFCHLSTVLRSFKANISMWILKMWYTQFTEEGFLRQQSGDNKSDSRCFIFGSGFPFLWNRSVRHTKLCCFIYPFLTMCSDTQPLSWPWTPPPLWQVEALTSCRCESSSEHAWRYCLLPNDAFMRLPPYTGLPALLPSDIWLPSPPLLLFFFTPYNSTWSDLLISLYSSPTFLTLHSKLCYLSPSPPHLLCHPPPLTHTLPPTPLFFISVGNNNTQCGCL